ncbi:MAG TPA: hypothetical protein VF315_09115, partial [Steroidobacteraceae bacterium]
PANVDPSLVTYTHVIYALHALAVFIGLTTAAFVVTAFVGTVPSIVAVIMNYARRAETRGTYLESHFRWQIRTFWFALLWVAAIFIICAPFVLVLIGIPMIWFGLAVLGVWVIYRVARGWLALRDARPMYT